MTKKKERWVVKVGSSLIAHNEVGIDVSSSGWDSEMIEYAYVFNHKGRKYMLYNGNNYGYDGIGLAVSV